MGKILENDAKRLGLGVQTHGCQRCRYPEVCLESLEPGLFFFHGFACPGLMVERWGISLIFPVPQGIYHKFPSTFPKWVPGLL